MADSLQQYTPQKPCKTVADKLLALLAPNADYQTVILHHCLHRTCTWGCTTACTTGLHEYAFQPPKTVYLCKTAAQNVKKGEEKAHRKVFLSQVPVFFQNPFTFFKKACVFFQILALHKLYIYAVTGCKWCSMVQAVQDGASSAAWCKQCNMVQAGSSNYHLVLRVHHLHENYFQDSFVNLNKVL